MNPSRINILGTYRNRSSVPNTENRGITVRSRLSYHLRNLKGSTNLELKVFSEPRMSGLCLCQEVSDVFVWIPHTEVPLFTVTVPEIPSTRLS